MKKLSTETKSVFLYGKPTQKKQELFAKTQKIYTDLINEYIDKLVSDSSYYLDLFNNNKKASKIRELEKETRKSNKIFFALGSAYGQNAIDHAVKEGHNHFIRIKNKLYGYCYHKRKELLPYVESIALLNASILDVDEIDLLRNLIQYEETKEKPSKSKITFYQELTEKIKGYSLSERQESREEVRSMFYEKLDTWKIPFVKKANIQLDARVYHLEKSKNIDADYVLSFKVFGEKKYIEIPLKTSENSVRRLAQYKNGSPIVTMKNAKLKVSIPFEKKIIEIKTKKIVGIDLGITDLIFSLDNQKYGSFSNMTQFYEEVLEPKLKKRSSLRNKMREYQKELRKKSIPKGKRTWLREKISNIANTLNGQKTVNTCKRKYAHEVGIRLNRAIKPFVKEVKKEKAMVAMESLDITTFDRGTKANKRDSSWVRGKVTTKIQKSLTWNGIPWVEVDPAYTSKACPTCFTIHHDNRIFKKFVCTVCKHEDDADYNASVNIKYRAKDKELKKIVEDYPYSTKERHTAIKKLYAKRHDEWLMKHTVAEA